MNKNQKQTTNKNTKSGHLSVRLPIHLFNKIEKRAFENNISTSTALRELIESK